MSIKIGQYSYQEFDDYNGNLTAIAEIDYEDGAIIPSKFTSIGRIINCSSIVLHDNITSIGDIEYSSLIIPESVETITKIVGCGGNERRFISISIKNKIPPLIGDICNLSPKDSLTVPQGALNSYKNDPTWGKFKNISENPRLNTQKANKEETTSSNEEINELRSEITELRYEIAELKNEINTLKNKEANSNPFSSILSNFFDRK